MIAAMIIAMAALDQAELWCDVDAGGDAGAP